MDMLYSGQVLKRCFRLHEARHPFGHPRCTASTTVMADMFHGTRIADDVFKHVRYFRSDRKTKRVGELQVFVVVYIAVVGIVAVCVSEHVVGVIRNSTAAASAADVVVVVAATIADVMINCSVRGAVVVTFTLQASSVGI